MHRPLLALINLYKGLVPSMAMIDCVVSTIISIFSTPFSSFSSDSRISKNPALGCRLFRMVTLGSITTKLSGSLPAGFLHQRADEDIQRTQSPAFFHLLGKGFDAYADKGRKRCFLHSLCQFFACGYRGFIFFFVAAVAYSCLQNRYGNLRWLLFSVWRSLSRTPFLLNPIVYPYQTPSRIRYDPGVGLEYFGALWKRRATSDLKD